VAAYPLYSALSQRGLLDPIKPAYQQSRSDVIIIIIYVINMPITYQKLPQLDCGRGRGVVGRGKYWKMTLALQSWTKPWQDVTANVDVKKFSAFFYSCDGLTFFKNFLSVFSCKEASINSTQKNVMIGYFALC